MRRVRSIIGLLAAALLFAHGQAAAQTTLEKAARDEVFNIPQDDPDMAAAVRRARASLPGFFKLAASPKPPMKNFQVKVAVRHSTGREFFWIRPFERKGNGFFGQLANTPRVIQHLKAGDTITFRENEIVDWTYFEDGKMRGHYTMCPLLKREPREHAQAYIKQYELDCQL
jgi:uncharacterized protein YegJ (DUF2314 family)